MPVYDYDCAACRRRIEVVHGVHAPGPAHCPNCGGGPLRKAISAAAVHFKGSGWAKKERRATVAPGGAKAGDTAGDTSGDAATVTSGESREDRGSTDSSVPDGTGADRKRADERPASPAKTAGTGTATKTD